MLRLNLLKRNNLMLRSERRERLEAWAASDSPILHSLYWVDRDRPLHPDQTDLERIFRAIAIAATGLMDDFSEI